jgi:excisionase family DNA binding protein
VSDTSDFMSVQQAAAHCGVAERTVRRWIASGRLKSVNARRGVRVARADLEAFTISEPGESGHVPDGPDTLSDTSDGHDGQARPGPTPESDTPGIVEALRLVEKLQQQNLELAGRVGYYQAQLEQLRDQLALQAPQVDDLHDVVLPPAEPQPDEQDEKARPWWRFW